MAKSGMEVRCFEFAIFSVRPAVIYIHFPDSSVANKSVWKMLIKSSAFVLSILWAKLFGSQIVWEVNNLRSHECHFPLFEAILMAVFVRSVSATVHYSNSSARETFKLYPVLRERPSVVIPHPNFHHIYSKRGNALRGRRILGVEKEEVVLIAFGLIRRYKGTKELIELFTKLEDTRLRLVVAGRPVDEAYALELRRVALSDSRVQLIFRDITDEELPDIFATVTLNCAPFRTILNSGSVILALSFACPVLAPRLGSLRDLEKLVGSEWITLYDGELTLKILSEAVCWAQKERVSVPELSFCDIEKITADTLAFLTKIRAT